MEPEVRKRFERIEAAIDQMTRQHLAAIARMDKAEARTDKAEARMDRADARMERLEARMAASDARFEKRMRGFEKLAMIGMKELAQLRKLHKDTDEKLNALIDAQQRTEAELRAFLATFRKGANGHPKSGP